MGSNAQETKHTPLPWIDGVVTVRQLDYKQGLVIVKKAEEGEAIAVLSPLDKATATDYKNAEFIVNACNSYYELLDALKMLVNISSVERVEAYEVFMAYDNAKELIAKAEVK